MSVELYQSNFLTILSKKNLTAARVLRINIWLSILVPKIKFDPPPQGKSALVLIIKVFPQIDNIGNIAKMEILMKKGNLFSTPWKIIIPLGNSVWDHIWVIQIHLGG